MPSLIDDIKKLQDDAEKMINRRADAEGSEVDWCMKAVVHIAEPMGGVSALGVLSHMRFNVCALMKPAELVVSLQTAEHPKADVYSTLSSGIEAVAAGSGKGKTILTDNLGERCLNSVFDLVAAVASRSEAAFRMVEHHHPTVMRGMSMEGVAQDMSIANIAKNLELHPHQNRVSNIVRAAVLENPCVILLTPLSPPLHGALLSRPPMLPLSRLLRPLPAGT